MKQKGKLVEVIKLEKKNNKFVYLSSGGELVKLILDDRWRILIAFTGSSLAYCGEVHTLNLK